jgi:predicted helicase
VSQLLIQQYLNQLETLKRVSGTTRESVVREAFKDLLKGWARSHDLYFVPEHEVAAPTKERRYVDGALMHTLRVPFGYWEAKDTEDDLHAAIDKKLRAGYPKTNIIFENSRHALLIQHGQEVMRCFVDDVVGLEKLLKLFFAYERPEIEAFRKAVEQFKEDLPDVLDALRSMIEREFAKDPTFRKAAHDFLVHVQEAVNPSLVEADVREMLIQHVLTGEVFAAVFPGTTYHQDNNIARELHKLEDTFFTGNTRFQTLKGLEPYYAAIRKAASEIQTHSEKQSFLKAIYGNFYKVYNPKAADRLGVVYTPNEIVRFMIEGADWLCEKHFHRNLIDHDVQILDPATGTGTFICEILQHFSGQKAKLSCKYQSELHANEVAILPYYVANLNIEATYAAITGEYKEFPNLCFVDTLDNTYGLRKHKGHMDDIFGSVTDVNVQRIRNQNSKRISVIIGNPPYNANQLNERENNKNREYPEIDKRIRETYIEASTAQKTKVYDMYARFFRWASDRLDENGVLAFITNRSFIESRTFDGFRAIVSRDFNEIWIQDLGGDVRANPKLSGSKHNVFGIQTGVAISFMVKRAKTKGCRIFYARRPEMETAEEKLAYLGSHRLGDAEFPEIQADDRHSWINVANTDFTDLIPIASKEAKNSQKPGKSKTIFRLYSQGVKTNRDEWVWGLSRDEVLKRVKHLVQIFNATLSKLPASANEDNISALLGTEIKWTRKLKKLLASRKHLSMDDEKAITGLYRPYVKQCLYFAWEVNEDWYQLAQLFPPGRRNRAIVFTDTSPRAPFSVLAVDAPFEHHLAASSDSFQAVSAYCYTADGHQAENITDWALDEFRKRYRTGQTKNVWPITKDAIFHYVYAVLHDPIYREKYALNLKRDFPHIPFYLNFRQWAEWGERLIDLHLGYESVTPMTVKRTDVSDEKSRKAGLAPKSVLKSDNVTGRIVIDSETTIEGIPPEAWEYRLGNRSALDWVLDQYRESAPKDPTIREKFNTYRLADYKEELIDLLARVATVSVDTVRVVNEMKQGSR